MNHRPWLRYHIQQQCTELRHAILYAAIEKKKDSSESKNKFHRLESTAPVNRYHDHVDQAENRLSKEFKPITQAMHRIGIHPQDPERCGFSLDSVDLVI